MTDNEKTDHIKQSLNTLKKELSRQRKKTGEIENLMNKTIKHHYPVDLWELSGFELDKEMGSRLSFLNEDIDSSPTGKITSHRKFLGVFIISFKKLMRSLFYPFFLKLFFEKQQKFNEDAVTYNLASFIRFRLAEKKLEELEQGLEEIKEKQEAILDAIKSLSGNPQKNDAKHNQ